MNQSFRVDLIEGGRGLALGGLIGEGAAIPPMGGEGPLAVDLDQVERINSSGLMVWLKWLHDHKHRMISVRRCRPQVAELFGLVASSLPANVLIDSFYVPFAHEASGETRQVLFSAGADFDAKGRLLRPLSLHEGGKDFTLDALPDQYFRLIAPRNVSK